MLKKGAELMNAEEKIEFLEEIMEIEEGELTEDLRLDDLEEWDSITKLSLMAAIKKKNNKVITVDELKSFQTVKDICDYLE